MIELVRIPIMEVPEQISGFLKMPNLAGQRYPQAFQGKSSYPQKTLEKTLSGKFYFDDKGVAKGSNPFILTLMNQRGMFPEGEHLLSISEFGRAFNKDPDKFKGTYQDTAIIIRANGGYVAKKLYKEIQKRGIVPTQEKPVVLSLTDLKLRKDTNSPYGVVFTLKEEAEPIVAPEYGTKESATKFSIYDERGVPIPNKAGDYTIWKGTVGAARVYSGCGQNAHSGGGRLAGSGDLGRVVVGKLAVPKNLAEIEKRVAEAEEEAARTKKDLTARIANL